MRCACRIGQAVLDCAPRKGRAQALSRRPPMAFKPRPRVAERVCQVAPLQRKIDRAFSCGSCWNHHPRRALGSSHNPGYEEFPMPAYVRLAAASALAVSLAVFALPAAAADLYEPPYEGYGEGPPPPEQLRRRPGRFRAVRIRRRPMPVATAAFRAKSPAIGCARPAGAVSMLSSPATAWCSSRRGVLPDGCSTSPSTAAPARWSTPSRSSGAVTVASPMGRRATGRRARTTEQS